MATNNYFFAPPSSDATEENPPDPAGEVRALSNIGYTTEEALADIVDNSIDAQAKNITIRFVYALYDGEETTIQILICDDGVGMTDQTIRKAMQLGVVRERSSKALGMFGMGLKTASFSQCRKFYVMSRARNSAPCGRAWDREQIAEKGWRSEILRADQCRELLERDWSPVNTSGRGTIVLWEQLKNPLRPRGTSGSPWKAALKPIQTHLGLVFHRLFKSRRFSVTLQVQKIGTPEPELTLPVEPLDPFGYQQPGRPHYPVDFPVKLDATKLTLKAHIWPANSKAPEYKLGGKAATAQGFYFYRNDRLLQAGGWNGVRGDGEPHQSLARVEIHLPSDGAGEWVTTQKFHVDAPPEFANVVKSAKAHNLAWSTYVSDAREVYDAGPDEAEDEVLVAGPGFQKALCKATREALADGRKGRPIRLEWKKMSSETVFEVDRAAGVLFVNKRFQLHLKKANSGLTEALLFLLTIKEFEKLRGSAKRDEWLEACNLVFHSMLPEP